MKKLMVVLLVLVMAGVVSGIGTSTTRRGSNHDYVKFSGVDSVLISGADTVDSDWFNGHQWGYINIVSMFTQANDSVDVDSVLMLGAAGQDTALIRQYDINGSIAYVQLLSNVSDTGCIAPDTTNKMIGAPVVNRWKLRIYTGSNNGTNTILKFPKSQVF